MKVLERASMSLGPPATSEEPEQRPWLLLEQWATRLHWPLILGAIVFWAYLDRHLWFFDDEWEFLLARGIWYAPANPHSIWFPHFGHWSTLPVLVWRALYNIFHLSTYWPYLIALLATSAAVLELLWVICRRSVLSPLLSLGVVAVVGFLGPGGEDLGWAFQIGFMGSLAFGLAAISRASAAQAGASTVARGPSISVLALASLMCSTVGDAMVVALAVVLFARYTRREVLKVLALPVASYAIWWAFVGRLGPGQAGSHLQLATFTDLPGYVWTGLATALGRTFNLESIGGTVLVGFLAWFLWDLRDLLNRRPAIAGLGAAGLLFYLLVGLGRDTSGDFGATAPRYIYIAVALILPVIACALTDLAERVTSGPADGPAESRRVVLACGTVILLLTALGDAGQAQTWATGRTALVRGLKTEIEASAQLLASGVRDIEGPAAAPVGYSPDLTVAMLVRIERAHLLPASPLSPASLLDARGLLQLGLTERPLFSGRFYVMLSRGLIQLPGGNGCTTYSPTAIGAAPSLLLTPVSPRQAASVEVAFPTAAGSDNRAVIGASLVTHTSRGALIPAAVPLDVPGNGRAYIDDTYTRAHLLLRWTAAMPIRLCSLGTRAGTHRGTSRSKERAFGGSTDRRGPAARIGRPATREGAPATQEMSTVVGARRDSCCARAQKMALGRNNIILAQRAQPAESRAQRAQRVNN